MFRAGDGIGPYKLIRKLGKGGFGEVWLAEESGTIMSPNVALKILMGDEPDLEAVKQEAAVWIQASGHPNVLSIIKAAQYGNDVIIVSEYAPDGSLKDWLNRHG